MNKFKTSINILKIDKDKQMVFGYASTPQLDSDGEIITIEAMKGALSEYMKFPTIREMHQAKAVGTTKKAHVDEKGLYIEAKVVDKGAWELVKEGVYKAFSIGGNVLNKVKNRIEELDLVEISLVDVPANKGALIGAWKGKDIEKNSNTVYALSNLMINLKDMISWFTYLKKDSEVKKLTKILEQIKAIISTEALELEPEKTKEDLLLSMASVDTEKLIKSLELADFGENQIANQLRKGVIIGMKMKLKEEKAKEAETLIKAEEAKEEPEKVEGDKTEVKVEEEGTKKDTDEKESKDESKESPVKVEEKDEEAEDEKSEEKESEEEKESSADVTLEKVNKSLEKLGATKEEAKENPGLAKTVSALTATLSKVTSVLESFEERVLKLEQTPAAAKSKAVFVKKAIEEEAEEDKSQDKSVTSEVEQLTKRKEELNKLFDSLGANQFAKQGFSLEAGKIATRLEQLARA